MWKLELVEVKVYGDRYQIVGREGERVKEDFKIQKKCIEKNKIYNKAFRMLN